MQFSFSLILAADRNYVIYYEIVEENVNSNIMKNFLNNLIIQEKYQVGKKKLIYLDNASVHRETEVINLIIEKKVRVVFGVPYYCKYDIVELIFNFIKNRVSNVARGPNHAKILISRAIH